MNKVLKNDLALVQINKLGAEVVSFKKIENDCEYMWNGDEKYWSGHAPVLFPIVCAANNGEIKVDGQIHKIGNHGFARKSEFELIEESDTKAVYRLSYDENTLAMYPFKFTLYICYSLEGNKLKINYKVENADNKEIYFQIGTHSGFNCPLDKGDKFEDYYLEFECNETLERLFMNDANVLISGKSKVILENNNILPLTRELFKDGALVFRNINSKQVELKSKTSDKSVVLSYENHTYMGLWQAKDANFVCIEPWHGIADKDDFNGEFKEKEMIITLKKGTSFECNHTIEIN
ncbi:MAG TPA: aldose 1-epimerase family protein [Clostridium sp.]